MKKIFIPLILICLTISSCITPKSEVLTEEKKLAIIEELKIINEKVFEAFTNKDVEAAFSYMDADNFLRFIDNGRIMEDYNKVFSNFKGAYSGFNTSNFYPSDIRITVLSESSALMTNNVSQEIVTTDGHEMKIHGAMTTVFQKINENWRIVHVHQSYNTVKN